jgi:2'-5' RNA ligase
MRLFIAIDIPSEIKQLFERVEQRLKKCDLAAKWVEPKNVHLTLKFLGEVEEQKIPLIKNAMENTAHQFKSFRVSLENFGFFPAERNPRVFFAGTDKEDILRNIYQKIEEELFTIGFGKENRFAAHLT